MRYAITFPEPIMTVVEQLWGIFQIDPEATFTYEHTTSTVELNQAAYDVLRDLDEDHDGHIDDSALMWIGGGEYAVETITDEHEQTPPVTTSYGDWGNHIGGPSMREHVIDAIGEFASQYDIDTIVDIYREGINAALIGTGVTLCGDEFYGHHPRREIDIAGRVASVDFWAIVERNEIAQNGDTST